MEETVVHPFILSIIDLWMYKKVLGDEISVTEFGIARKSVSCYGVYQLRIPPSWFGPVSFLYEDFICILGKKMDHVVLSQLDEIIFEWSFSPFKDLKFSLSIVIRHLHNLQYREN